MNALSPRSRRSIAIVKVTQAEYEHLADFRYSLRQFLHFSEEAAQKAGVTPQQHQALLAIKGFPEARNITIGELAERLRVRHHSAVGLVDRLVLKGFITRQHAGADRRQVHLALTEGGRRTLEELSSAHKEQLRRVGRRMESLLKHLRG
jgi:DNA-binding MarR family transcriptional regulator